MALLTWLLFLLALRLVTRRAGTRSMAIVAAAAWLSLPVYNHWVVSNCPGDCGIRVDLLIVGPVLLLVTLAWLWAWWRQRGSRPTRKQP